MAKNALYNAYGYTYTYELEDRIIYVIGPDGNIFIYDKMSNIITTGNELVKQEIADFSKMLDIEVLYEYALSLKANTDEWLKNLQYEDVKKKFGDDDKKRISELGVVSNDEQAVWLIDYWCNKDISGLIKMPLSRHWIMHIEAANRIKEKILQS